jgi:CheY-like chemotaxis protein
MLTVLVADDEFAVLEVLTMAIEAEGYRVLKAGDGADALRVLHSQPCDLVVCDEAMPMMDGGALVNAMQADPRLRVIPAILMVETFGPPHAPVEGAHLVTKPVRLAELFRVIAALTARPK